MRNQLSLSTTPTNESCVQVGSEFYWTNSKIECKAFIEQLIRIFGNPPGNAQFKITENPHDFGTYHDVVIEWDESNKQEDKYAYKVEANLPEDWDTIALKTIHGSEHITISNGITLGKPLTVFFEKLLDFGYAYDNCPSQPGQFCQRGMYLDIFSFGAEQVNRIELNGDDVETVYALDPDGKLLYVDTFLIYAR
jgi:hypothetical protein